MYLVQIIWGGQGCFIIYFQNSRRGIRGVCFIASKSQMREMAQNLCLSFIFLILFALIFIDENAVHLRGFPNSLDSYLLQEMLYKNNQVCLINFPV